MSVLKIVVAEGTFAGIELGDRNVGGAEVSVSQAPLGNADQIAAATADADGIIVGLQKFGADELAVVGQRVGALSRAGIGLDSIDLEAARNRGIAVIHQPDYATQEVATHAVAMLLAVNRKLVDADRIARAGWRGRRAISNIEPLHLLTAGVVGGGAIGRAVIARLAPLVRTVLVFDPFLKKAPAGAELVDSLDELLRRSDAITLHAPLSEQTRHMIGEEQIALLRPGAVIINVARGELLDTNALIAALRSGHLGGAGLDVFEAEPVPAEDLLNQAPNLLVSPHVAFLSTAAVAKLEHQVLEDLCTFLTEKRVTGGRIASQP